MAERRNPGMSLLHPCMPHQRRVEYVYFFVFCPTKQSRPREVVVSVRMLPQVSEWQRGSGSSWRLHKVISTGLTLRCEVSVSGESGLGETLIDLCWTFIIIVETFLCCFLACNTIHSEIEQFHSYLDVLVAC